MRNSLIVILFSLFFPLVSCQSKEVARVPAFDSSFSLTKKKLTLETVIANWNESLDKINSRDPAAKVNWQEELHRICLKQDDLCEGGYRSSSKREQFNKKLISEIKSELDKEDFAALQVYPIDIGLKFFSKHKKTKLLNYADTLLKDVECKTSDLRHALASALEDNLPDLEVKNTVQALYDQNSECPSNKTNTMSTYRAAMLRLVDQDCSKAVPLLQKVTNSSEDYLKPRSLYWSWRCQSESPDIKNAANEKLPFFSYHRIMMDAANSTTPESTTPLLEETPVAVESVKNPNLNEAARFAEKLIANQMTPAARAVLEKIRVDRLQEVEPEFQVYWARLLHITNAGIKKFQILATLINTHSQFRSKTIQLMLFPTSFFEHVEATSKKIDPWLIQSLIRQESAFDPRARSRVGATGLMQLMPATARRIVKTRGKLNDPVYNLQAGVKFLEILVNRFDGQVHLALAAYNAGPGKVHEWQKRYPTNDPMLFVDTIPYRETREYVAFILRNYHWYRSLNPEVEKSQLEPTSPLVRMATQIDSF